MDLWSDAGSLNGDGVEGFVALCASSIFSCLWAILYPFCFVQFSLMSPYIPSQYD